MGFNFTYALGYLSALQLDSLVALLSGFAQLHMLPAKKNQPHPPLPTAGTLVGMTVVAALYQQQRPLSNPAPKAWQWILGCGSL